jgi:uracil-DNA glycosylase family 4
MESLQISVDKRRFDCAGADAIGANLYRIVDRKLPRHGDHRTLGGAIGESSLDADEPGDGADVHHFPWAGGRRLEKRHGVLRHQVKAFDVDLVDPLEVRKRGFLDVAYQADAGVVYENIQLLYFGKGLFYLLFIGDIDRENLGAAKFRGQDVGPSLVQVRDNQGGAGGMEGAAGSFTDTACAAGNESYEALKGKGGIHPLHINPVGRAEELQHLNEQIAACERCPRLIAHCGEVARVRRRAYRDQEYWGKPVLGLAPGAHGANRTGRVFTGDRSGDLLYRVLHQTGFATQEESRGVDDGMTLLNARISCSAHCAPPDNKPSPEELRNCRPWLEQELRLLVNLRVVVTLGKIAFDSYLSILKDEGRVKRLADYPFAHNQLHALEPCVITSYHPSQQNTSTGKLTEAMLLAVFDRARQICA